MYLYKIARECRKRLAKNGVTVTLRYMLYPDVLPRPQLHRHRRSRHSVVRAVPGAHPSDRTVVCNKNNDEQWNQRKGQLSSYHAHANERTCFYCFVCFCTSVIEICIDIRQVNIDM